MPIGEGYFRFITNLQSRLLAPSEIEPKSFLWGLIVVTKLAVTFAAEYRPVRDLQAAGRRDQLQTQHFYGRQFVRAGPRRRCPLRGHVADRSLVARRQWVVARWLSVVTGALYHWYEETRCTLIQIDAERVIEEESESDREPSEGEPRWK